MAPAIGEKGGPVRVFVLVDKGELKGVFRTWDAAAEYADLHRLSLEHLYEFITRHAHPEHLHLLMATWGDDWEFQGEWKRGTPHWKRPPRKVRLDHYHLKRGEFRSLRQKEFVWSTGLLLKIDPMAPDMILEQIGSRGPNTSPPKQWRPKLGPLKTPPPVTGNSESKVPVNEKTAAQIPLISEPEPPVEEIPKKAPGPKDRPHIKPALERAPPVKPKLVSRDAAKPAESSKSGLLPLEEKPKITFPGKKPLKLKEKNVPKPIPQFEAAARPPVIPTNKSSVELAYQQDAQKDSSIGEEEASAKRRIYPMRLIIALLAVILCWSGGIFWVFRPQPTAREIISSVVALNRATVLPIEPGQVFFQLPVDPIHQQRFVQSLDMEPIPQGTFYPIPTHHALDSWVQSMGFVRPPYADIEVREWWDLRLRKIQYGFVLHWEDGSTLFLDLESDMLIGWMQARHLPTVLN